MRWEIWSKESFWDILRAFEASIPREIARVRFSGFVTPGRLRNRLAKETKELKADFYEIKSILRSSAYIIEAL
jgi:hypothetical protein